MTKLYAQTHGVNCTGSCSWKIYVKNGLVTWETQQTDLICDQARSLNMNLMAAQGASYSWYLVQRQSTEVLQWSGKR